eukprot:TRINITY_DN16754_c0_g2_i1.p1 TRINITY_DN16754_c0_g2~~TRINITY_DN16754_c0_g2_i1.p1  ORF type:complete len:202 (-),score=37.15 TRINITY_DN16754_c0_g2_i1:285-890(-)
MFWAVLLLYAHLWIVNSQVATPYLSLYYPCQANLQDMSGNALHGSASPAATTDRLSMWESAVTLSSTISASPSNNVIPQGASPRTIALWMKCTTTSTVSALVGWGTYGGTKQRFSLGLTNTNVLSFFSDGADFTGSGVVCDGNWHHVAVTYDGSTITLYRDGSVDATLTSQTLATSGSVRHPIQSIHNHGFTTQLKIRINK